MVAANVLDRAANVCEVVSGRCRMSVTELSRSNEWRARLPEAGVIEVTDRGDTAAWLVSDADLKSLVEGYSRLEAELEQAQIAALFKARDDSFPRTGDDLKAAALEAFDLRKDELSKLVLDGR